MGVEGHEDGGEPGDLSVEELLAALPDDRDLERSQQGDQDLSRLEGEGLGQGGKEEGGSRGEEAQEESSLPVEEREEVVQVDEEGRVARKGRGHPRRKRIEVKPPNHGENRLFVGDEKGVPGLKTKQESC